MQDHWRRLSLRNMSRFVAVAAIVAVVGVMIGREAGIGRQTGASVAPSPADEAPPLPQQQSEETTALTLTLSAPEICETRRAMEILGGESHRDEDGNWVQKWTSYGWGGVSSVPLRWQVSGGQAPYTLVIDHETNDAQRDYTGAAGVAQVGCADASVGTSIWPPGEPDRKRRYEVDPQVDSGWKTVRATVTDANGNIAETTTEIYVILEYGSTGDILRRGQTYRVDGRLMTAPASYDIVVGSRAEPSCAEYDPNPRCGDVYNGYGLLGTDAWITVYEDDGALHARWPEALSAVEGAQASPDPVTAAVDELVGSLGKIPQHRTP